MDFALFMERYGYKILLLIVSAAVLAVILTPFVMTFWAFSSSGIVAAVIAVIVFAIGIALMVVPKFSNFADKIRQTHIIEDWNEKK
ncbi:hypothetical protein [Thermococcus paralvinellae]|uniref:Membrane protein n=1 Tax=Thermococcus paralvinellae TaxID=582419 RepID=W0I5C4_9EURY|nr:hypothetical protein [Thermococcus paralvinellae]AHF81321.1 membrane protein [Thermococcus paralvinellae]